MLESKPREQFLADWKQSKVEQQPSILASVVTAKNKVRASQAPAIESSPSMIPLKLQ